MFTANAYGRAAALLAGVPHVVASERCVDPWKDWHQLALDRFLARRTDAIVVNSRGVQQFYVDKGCPPAKCERSTTPCSRASQRRTRASLLTELGLPRSRG